MINISEMEFVYLFAKEENIDIHSFSHNELIDVLRNIESESSQLCTIHSKRASRAAYSRELLSIKEKSEDKKKQTKPKNVYLFLSESGRYKIGISNNPHQRLTTLINSSSENHSMVFFYLVNDAFKVEQELHKAFSDKRLHSEWFELNDDDVVYIENQLKEKMC